ncbi:MAG TPA: ATP-binding protein [Anaerolineales bacterium]|nr:ATP-binding protein [Anaerolineales bacterium]
MKITQRINSWLEVPSSDPDDARRRRLLNIILAGVIILSALMQAFTIWLWFTTARAKWIAGASNIFWVTLGLLVAGIALFILNRFGPGWLASSLFLFVMTIAITFVDKPEQLVTGRSLFLFTLPIVLASMLLPSWTAFAAAGMSIATLDFLVIRMAGDQIALIPTFFTLGFIALLAWLSSRSVEVALRDLRKLNHELDQRVAERTLELSAALSRERIESGRIKAILESIADGVLVFDVSGIAIIANPSLTHLLEVQDDQLIGATISGFSDVKTMDTYNRGILNNLLTNPSRQLSNYRIQWGKKTLSVTSAQVVDRDGDQIGTVAVFRDYTHEAELERMKNTFLAIVSHELRTPLNAILGYAEMLKEAIYGPVNEKQTRAADRIMTNSLRLLDIVSDLLDQAQMEAGKLSLHIGPFRPADLIENVHGVLDKIAADKGLQLTSELDPELPEYINGDIARLQQILVNLINNASKFTEKGSIHMSILLTDKQHWSMKVEDTGIGIPEDELPKIFEAFRQVDSTATRKYGGFGLGLAIVKQLAELMEGNVFVKSQLGVGSTFSITLPINQARSPK